MEIRKDEFRWFFTTTLPTGQKFILTVNKSFFPKYTRKPKGITRQVLIQLAARAMRDRKPIGVILPPFLKVGMYYETRLNGDIDMDIYQYQR